MGTYERPAGELEQHKHPAIARLTVSAHEDDLDVDRLENFAENALSASWHVRQLPRNKLDRLTVSVQFFYVARGAERSDYLMGPKSKTRKPLDRLADSRILPSDELERAHFARRALCTCDGSRRGSDCTLTNQEARELILDALADLRQGLVLM